MSNGNDGGRMAVVLPGLFTGTAGVALGAAGAMLPGELASVALRMKVAPRQYADQGMVSGHPVEVIRVSRSNVTADVMLVEVRFLGNPEGEVANG
jgi:hypothetical protein